MPSTVLIKKRSSLYNAATPNVVLFGTRYAFTSAYLSSSPFLSHYVCSVSSDIIYVVTMNFVTMTTPTTIDSIWIKCSKGQWHTKLNRSQIFWKFNYWTFYWKIDILKHNLCAKHTNLICRILLFLWILLGDQNFYSVEFPSNFCFAEKYVHHWHRVCVVFEEVYKQKENVQFCQRSLLENQSVNVVGFFYCMSSVWNVRIATALLFFYFIDAWIHLYVCIGCYSEQRLRLVCLFCCHKKGNELR